MTDNKQIGVITEQGFVAGQGLGFIPTKLTENNNESDSKNEKQSN